MDSAVDEEPLHGVVPEKGHENGHHTFVDDIYVVVITAEQADEEGTVLCDLGQQVGPVGVEYDAQHPHGEIFDGDIAFLASGFRKHPSVVDDAVADAAADGTDSGGCYIVDAYYGREKYGDGKVDETADLGRGEGFDYSHKKTTQQRMMHRTMSP